jgi:crotonobetainyl-CoA:carnitine CoA-transferase CaiB-like acyl-CoA transferase
VFFDADNERLGLVAEYEHPVVGRMRQFGELINFSETPGRIAGPPPLVGEHTKEILAWLGYDAAQMQALREEGTVYWPDEDLGNYPWTV